LESPPIEVIPQLSDFLGSGPFRVALGDAAAGVEGGLERLTLSDMNWTDRHAETMQGRPGLTDRSLERA